MNCKFYKKQRAELLTGTKTDYVKIDIIYNIMYIYADFCRQRMDFRRLQVMRMTENTGG